VGEGDRFWKKSISTAYPPALTGKPKHTDTQSEGRKGGRGRDRERETERETPSLSHNNGLQQKEKSTCFKGLVSLGSDLHLILIFPSENKKFATGTHLNHGKWNHFSL
jgi:hypothetical protein